jgi:hypothetical protein
MSCAPWRHTDIDAQSIENELRQFEFGAPN